MRKYIEDFSSHLNQALEIGTNSSLKKSEKTFNNVLICGLGGSGIGGSIVSQMLASELKLPVTVNKNYSTPAFVDRSTLVILCSYSGNTEETIMMLDEVKDSGAEIACITSGGKLAQISKERGYNCIKIPGEMPPRAAFGFSFPQLLFMLSHYELITSEFISQFKAAIELLKREEEVILSKSLELAKNLLGKMPIIYSDASFEGVAVRFRQQINENAKMLCWHHSIPEMNHNELVGWRKEDPNLAVVLMRNESDFYRNQKRMEINKTIISKYTPNIFEINSKGNNYIEKCLYLVHFGDWVSMHLAELKKIDAVEVDIITYLKGELAKI